MKYFIAWADRFIDYRHRGSRRQNEQQQHQSLTRLPVRLPARLRPRTICDLLSAADESQLMFTPFHADGIYALGEKVGWTVTLAPNAVPPRAVSVTPSGAMTWMWSRPAASI